jgi:hypothetical protein
MGRAGTKAGRKRKLAVHVSLCLLLTAVGRFGLPSAPASVSRCAPPTNGLCVRQYDRSKCRNLRALQVLTLLRDHRASWPFREPVDDIQVMEREDKPLTAARRQCTPPLSSSLQTSAQRKRVLLAANWLLWRISGARCDILRTLV